VLLLTVRTGEAPSVAPDARVSVEPLGLGLYRGVIQFGFMDEPNVPKALADVSVPGLALDQQRVPYFVNRTRVISTPVHSMARWRERFYSLLRRNSVSPVDFFELPHARVIEIGTSVEV
jgi:KUP system potassium uptake protein